MFYSAKEKEIIFKNIKDNGYTRLENLYSEVQLNKIKKSLLSMLNYMQPNDKTKNLQEKYYEIKNASRILKGHFYDLCKNEVELLRLVQEPRVIDIVKGFFDAKRALWNEMHDIKIHGYEVEIYVEDINEAHISSGVYSITDDKWLAEPVRREEEVDVATARKKSNNIITRVNLIDRYAEEQDPKKVLRSIESLKNKIRRMRMAGLKSPRREYSPENIAFKILRREGILGKLNKMKQKAYDEEMSLNGISRDQ